MNRIRNCIEIQNKKGYPQVAFSLFCIEIIGFFQDKLQVLFAGIQ
jgi:hypothetical protein